MKAENLIAIGIFYTVVLLLLWGYSDLPILSAKKS